MTPMEDRMAIVSLHGAMLDKWKMPQHFDRAGASGAGVSGTQEVGFDGIQNGTRS